MTVSCLPDVSWIGWRIFIKCAGIHSWGKFLELFRILLPCSHFQSQHRTNRPKFSSNVGTVSCVHDILNWSAGFHQICRDTSLKPVLKSICFFFILVTCPHYENIPIQTDWKFYHQKWKFSNKNSDIFLISAQNIDCGYSLEPPQWGSSNEYPKSTFLSRNKKNNVYPCKPQFYYIKVGFKGVKIIQACFRNVIFKISNGQTMPKRQKKLQYVLCARYDLDLVGGFSSDLRATSLGIAFELF